MLLWIAFVPRVLRFDDKGMEIGFYFRPRHRLRWPEVAVRRRSRWLLVLRAGTRNFRIFAAAYPRRQMDALAGRASGTAPP